MEGLNRGEIQVRVREEAESEKGTRVLRREEGISDLKGQSKDRGRREEFYMQGRKSNLHNAALPLFDYKYYIYKVNLYLYIVY